MLSVPEPRLIGACIYPHRLVVYSGSTLWTVNRLEVLFEIDQLDEVVNVQPLYRQSIVILGNTRNVVFVATRAGTVYAFDADNAASLQQPHPWLWRTSLVRAGVH
jgi:outer membrane protein assembly factor BamB